MGWKWNWRNGWSPAKGPRLPLPQFHASGPSAGHTRQAQEGIRFLSDVFFPQSSSSKFRTSASKTSTQSTSTISTSTNTIISSGPSLLSSSKHHGQIVISGYQPDTTLNHNHNPVKSNMSPPQQPLSSPPPRHSEPSNPQSGAPPIDLSPLPFPTTPIILIPLRNSILDKFEDDSCNPAVIRLPAQEARFGGLSIHAYATKLLGTDTAAGAVMNGPNDSQDQIQNRIQNLI